MEEKHAYVFIGRSGSGKGTQAHKLLEWLESKQLEVLYIETGQGFRDFVQGEGSTVESARDILETGGREPDFLAIYVWASMFIEGFTLNKQVIVDGTPRSLHEAVIFDTALTFYGLKPVILDIEISRDEAIKRLQLRGREDDKNLTDIENRLDWFEADVTPAINHYKKSPLHSYILINGEQSVDDVHSEIIAKISQ